MIEKESLCLYAVTDRTWLGKRSLEQCVEEVLKGGATLIQLREKTLSREDFLASAKRIKGLCDRYQIPLIINDDVEIAVQTDAAGVHVGQQDMEISKARKLLGENKIIGASARTVEQALKAEREGADYLGVGAVFGTDTKEDAKPIDRKLLSEICKAVKIPVVAIGGISEENIMELRETGVSGSAVVSALFAKQDIREATKILKKKAEDILMTEVKKVLTIAGSDSSGGAGIQADIKTMLANGVYAMSAVTALTAQNTTGVFDILETTPENLSAQLDAVFTDIFPDAVKIGMVSGKELIHVIAEKLKDYQAEHIVLDPVMVSTSGSRLLKDDAMTVLTEELFPLAEVITPNLPEAELLLGENIRSKQKMEEAALKLWEKFHVCVLLKGGHLSGEASDVLAENGNLHWIPGERVQNPNTHGTGCTLSSAIASGLAKGLSMENAVKMSKEYLTEALKTGLSLGRGSGPLNHGYKFV